MLYCGYHSQQVPRYTGPASSCLAVSLREAGAHGPRAPEVEVAKHRRRVLATEERMVLAWALAVIGGGKVGAPRVLGAVSRQGDGARLQHAPAVAEEAVLKL